MISWGIVSVHEGLNGLRAQIPADCRWGKLSLSLHLLTPGRQLEARLGVVLRPGIEFACDWSDSLRLRLTGAPPQTTVLGRVISTPWAERQPGWMFESPFQVLPLLEEPAVTPLASEPDCAAGSAPTSTFLGRTDGEGKVVWAVPRTPGLTVHVSARDVRGGWVEAYFEA